MSRAVLATLAITGFGVAFFHAAIPTHWLPFVLTSRVQRWSRAKTILITAFAGTGHVLATAFLGFWIAWFGTALNKSIGDWFPRVAGAALILFGIYYIVRQLGGHGHVHFPYPHEHLHEGHDVLPENPRSRTSDRAAITSLLAFLTLSPCEGFLPFYVSGIRYGLRGFAILTAILSLGTVLGMLLFTTLTLVGLSRIKLALLEKYESLIMGTLLCTVGFLILLFEH
jgi:nickel/cobalt exporter